MQTFLPYKDFARSAKVLDRQRLGKQRVEGLQILQCLLGIGSLRWKNHPAVKMWKGHEPYLVRYIEAICDEWTSRGYKDTVKTKIQRLCDVEPMMTYSAPLWLGDTKFHRSHQSNLIRKLPAHYRQYFPTISSHLPYVWPDGAPCQDEQK
jgi:hypothetical protein